MENWEAGRREKLREVYPVAIAVQAEVKPAKQRKKREGKARCVKQTMGQQPSAQKRCSIRLLGDWEISNIAIIWL
jgi:hypothetical protein